MTGTTTTSAGIDGERVARSKARGMDQDLYEASAMRKPILSLDFDGVLHSYSSGWKGADVIPDPPEGRETVTIYVPAGYKNAREFMNDCQFERAGDDVRLYSEAQVYEATKKTIQGMIDRGEIYAPLSPAGDDIEGRLPANGSSEDIKQATGEELRKAYGRYMVENPSLSKRFSPTAVFSMAILEYFDVRPKAAAQALDTYCPQDTGEAIG